MKRTAISGVGSLIYHSHNPVYQQQYLLSVLKQALRLEALPQKKDQRRDCRRSTRRPAPTKQRG